MPANDRPWDRDDRDEDERPRRRDDRDDDDDDRPRRRDEYDDRPPTPKSNGLATAGLILGVLSLITCGLTTLPGIICSAIALGKPTGRGMAVAGLILSLLGILVGGIVGVVLMLPAVSKVREAAARTQDSNNLKMLGLGMHNAEATHGSISQYARDDFGKVQTGLSFRVEMLKYMEQENLYRQFDKTQPWDGPTNRSLSNTPIKWYTSPYETGGVASVNTPYRVFVGGGAIFDERSNSASLMTITDGTSNTILMVHATEQVPWAQPKELPYSATAPLPKFGQPGMQGFNVALADGSVRFIRNTTSERTLRLLITKADGNVIPSDW